LSRKDSTALLTNGRLPVGLEIARAFHAAGWRVLVADPWPTHLCAYSRAVEQHHRLPSPQANETAYLDTIRRIADTASADLIVPVSEETPWVAGIDDPRVFSLSRRRVLTLHDKLTFAERATEIGLSVPDTARADRGDHIAASDFIHKPRFSCSGRSVEKVRGGAPFRRDPSDIVQTFIAGQTVSVFAVARDGNMLAAVAYRATLLDGSVAIAFERSLEDATSIEWSRSFVEKTGHTGFIAFDFIVDAEGAAHAVECNPRATSGIHFLSGDAIVAAITGAMLPSEPFRPETRLCERWSCLTRWFGDLTKPAKRHAVASVLSTHSDVSFTPADPWPCVLMPINSRRVLWRAAVSGQRFASAAVADIEWLAHDDHRAA